jgi:transcriptional regulator with XRE-family HTH domain
VKRYDPNWEQATLQKLGEDLARLRNSTGFSQTFVACELDTQKPSISRLENGRTNATWLTVSHYARLMGYEIVFRKADDSPNEKGHAG